MNNKMNTNFWQITEFAIKITEGMENASVHYNTVAKWFNTLETKGIHYVNRAAGEKIYDELDLRIGRFIYEKREEKWRLDVIFNAVPDYVGSRPFPTEYEDNDITNIAEIEELLLRKITVRIEEQLHSVQMQIEKRLEDMVNTKLQSLLPYPKTQEEIMLERENIEKSIEEFVITKIDALLPEPKSEEDVKSEQETLEKNIQQLAETKINSLIPKSKTEEELRAERFNYAVLQMRIGLKLEDEALELWRQQPDHIRLKRVSLFRKEENIDEKDRFIRNYKFKNMEKALREELDL